IFPVNTHTTLTRQLDSLIYYGEGRDSDSWVDSFLSDPLYNYDNKQQFISPLLKLSISGNGNLIEYTTLDAYKRSNEDVSSNGLENLTEVTEYLYRLNAFANNSDAKTMYVIAPTLAHRSSSIMVKIPRISASTSSGMHNEIWGSSYQDMFRTALVQDIKSMQKAYAFAAKKIEKGDLTGLIEHYHYTIDKKTKKPVLGNCMSFSQLSLLNDTAVGKEIIEKFGKTGDDQFLTNMRQATSLVAQAMQEVESFIENQTNLVREDLDKLNINKEVESKSGKTTYLVNPLDLKAWKGDLDAFLRDYVIATIIGQNELRKFTAGYVLLAKNYQDYAKRM